jgi:hypothetical protein
MYVGKPVRITDPSIAEEVLGDSTQELVGYINDLEDDTIAGYVFAEVTFNTMWTLGGSTMVVPMSEYIEGWHLEELVTVWQQ